MSPLQTDAGAVTIKPVEGSGSTTTFKTSVPVIPLLVSATDTEPFPIAFQVTAMEFPVPEAGVPPVTVQA